jgi:hypothetical protein
MSLGSAALAAALGSSVITGLMRHPTLDLRQIRENHRTAVSIGSAVLARANSLPRNQRGTTVVIDPSEYKAFLNALNALAKVTNDTVQAVPMDKERQVLVLWTDAAKSALDQFSFRAPHDFSSSVLTEQLAMLLSKLKPPYA